MTREEILELVATSEDLSVFEHLDGELEITVEDFEGFDNDGCEIERDLVNEDLVYEIRDTLRENADRVEGWDSHYWFGALLVTWYWASDDI